LFKSRNFTVGCLCISLAYMLYFGAIVLLPQLLQEVYGYTATWAGLASAPVGLIPVIAVADHRQVRQPARHETIGDVQLSLCMRCASTGAPILLNRVWTFGASAWPQFIQGFAIACFFMPLTTITLSGLPPERHGGGIEPVELYSNTGGVNRDIDHHDLVDPARIACITRS
jgi:DHA2 family multidrug resistance protein